MNSYKKSAGLLKFPQYFCFTFIFTFCFLSWISLRSQSRVLPLCVFPLGKASRTLLLYILNPFTCDILLPPEKQHLLISSTYSEMVLSFTGCILSKKKLLCRRREKLARKMEKTVIFLPIRGRYLHKTALPPA